MHEERDALAALEADLAALAAADADLERDAEAAERTRIERSALTLADRLRAATSPIRLDLRGGASVSGRVAEVGSGAVVLLPEPRGPVRAHLVLVPAVQAVHGLGREVRPDAAVRPTSTAALLRRWCRDRAVVSVDLVDGTHLTGIAGATYADHVDLVLPSGRVAVPLAAVALVSR